MKNAQYKFLKTLCDLFDGENYVPESSIRDAWPECPSHNTLLNLGKDYFFEYNLDLQCPGYKPTAKGLDYIHECRNSAAASRITVATLVVAILTLIATCAIPLLQALLQQ